MTINHNKNKGLTLVELLVSIAILTMVMTAIYSILIAQQNRAMQVSRTSVMQTDAQVALSLIKWDLMMAGLAKTWTDPSLVTGLDNFGGAGPDRINIKSVGLGFEISNIHWSFVLGTGPAGANWIAVRRFNDPQIDIALNDVILIINQERYPIQRNVTVTAVTPFNYTFPNGEVVAANRLTLSIVFANDVSNALAAFTYSTPLYDQGLAYYVDANKRLIRDQNNTPEVLLDNVEDFQLAFGIDNNNDGQIDQWRNPPEWPNSNYDRKWVVRFTMVMTSGGMPGYIWSDGAITTENHTYTPAGGELKKKRSFVSTVVYPQNLQF